MQSTKTTGFHLCECKHTQIDGIQLARMPWNVNEMGSVCLRVLLHSHRRNPFPQDASAESNAACPDAYAPVGFCLCDCKHTQTDGVQLARIQWHIECE